MICERCETECSGGAECPGKKLPDLNEPRHCDEYIHDYQAPMCLRWFLFVRRLPAIDGMLCMSNGVKPKLFAKHNGKRVRVVMASRFGDVGITENLNAENGYSLRVAVADLTDFTDQQHAGKR